jgi:hypothetical protein
MYLLGDNKRLYAPIILQFAKTITYKSALDFQEQSKKHERSKKLRNVNNFT